MYNVWSDIIKKDLISVKEAADILGCDVSYARRLCSVGRLDAKRVGNSWVIHKPSVVRFSSAQKRPKERL